MDNQDNIQVTELVEDTEVAAEEAVAAAPVVKTKKELKKERKELKKHKKEVKKEAQRHSAKATKAQNFFMSLISILVIVAMLVCTYSAIQITRSVNGAQTAASGNENNENSDNKGSSSTPNQGSSSNNNNSSATNTIPKEDSSNASSEGGDNAASGDLSTPAGVVALYKSAHAKVLSEAKSATHTYNNTVNYKDHLEIGGNSTLAGIAKTLMNQFMKEETNLATYQGADIAAKFPGSNVQNLTPDMLSKAECVEDGNNYVLTLVVNSSDESYDLGEKTGCVTQIIDEKQITDAAGSMVKLNGLENRYCGATVKATIDKASGHMIAFESDVPSYMCFGEAKVAIISVKDVSLGLEYLQKWTIEY